MNAKEMLKRFEWIGDCFKTTYFFWAGFSLLNFGFLAPLAFPPLLPLWWSYWTKFVPFLIAPALFAAVLTALAALLLHCVLRGILTLKEASWLMPLLLNALFLTALLNAADWSRKQEIAAALVGHTPDCVAVRSFYNSLLTAGEGFPEPHAIFIEDGTKMIWSYSEMAFVEAPDHLGMTLSC